MINRDEFLKATAPQRQEMRAKAAAELDAKLQAAHPKLLRLAVAEAEEADKAEAIVEAAKPGDYHLAEKTAAAAEARDRANLSARRANTVKGGRWPNHRVDVEDLTFCLEHQVLRSLCGDLDRLDSE